MKRTYVRFRTASVGVLAMLSLGAPALRSAAQNTPPVPAASAPKPARLNYQIHTLANGLKVVTLEDHRAPVVTLQIWYHVGSKDEAGGRSGFAHLFEHLMFKGSAHVGPQEHARYVEQIGGDYNANTWFDRTLYYETVPSNALERLLWLEADRMSSLRVDEATMKSERSVVEEEKRLRVDNAPYGTLFEDVFREVFPPNHPYYHPTIGSVPDLEAAKLADVRAFHNEYYKPDNATMVLVGDITTADALKKIQRYYGVVPRSRKAFTRYPVPAVTQTTERRVTVYDKLAPLPVVGMAFRLPVPADPDTPVFTIISAILSEDRDAHDHARRYR